MNSVWGDFDSSGCRWQKLLKKKTFTLLSPVFFTLTHRNRMLPNDASLPSFLHLTHTHTHTHTHSQPISPSHYCVSLSFSISFNVPCFNTCLATFPPQTSNLLSASVSLYVTLNFTVKPPLLTIHSSLPAAVSIFNLLHLSLQLRKNKWGGSGSGGRRCGYSSLATDWRGKDRSGLCVCVCAV